MNAAPRVAHSTASDLVLEGAILLGMLRLSYLLICYWR